MNERMPMSASAVVDALGIRLIKSRYNKIIDVYLQTFLLQIQVLFSAKIYTEIMFGADVWGRLRLTFYILINIYFV